MAKDHLAEKRETDSQMENKGKMNVMVPRNRGHHALIRDNLNHHVVRTMDHLRETKDSARIMTMTDKDLHQTEKMEKMELRVMSLVIEKCLFRETPRDRTVHRVRMAKNHLAEKMETVSHRKTKDI